MSHKSGFVNIIGNPNVGKSTLINALTGEKISIISPKAQTTRQRVLGFLSTEEYQIVFSDTPGFVEKPSYELHRKMLGYIDTAFEDADIVLMMVEPGQKEIHAGLLLRLQNLKVPLIVIINKIDLSNQDALKELFPFYENIFPNADIISVSALHNFNIDVLLGRIVEKLPDHPPYYPKDVMSDRNLRFFVSEMIREQIFHIFDKEIPYHSEVVIDYFREEEEIPKIGAIIYVSRESQKKILIGHEGKSIKKLGSFARKNIEGFMGQHVFLDLTIKVKDWRDNDKTLTQLGY
ncbi:MAG: GTPase Era [Bacteroidetes bacterium HGW-Bacteroidetes-6]|jgi:GTP-binding protein Era|nr:MAG: GTPase Era [Bacteroidetes bacterium HGW-Bacteroidetes-6]